MSSLYKKFATDKKAQNEGVLYEMNDDDGTPLFHVRLARFGGDNVKFSQRYTELMKPYRKVRSEDLPEKTQERISLQLFCETVVIPGTWETYRDGQWVKGIENPQGDIVPATAANYQIVLGELSELRRELQSEASNLTNFRRDVLEVESENLSPASSTP